MKKILLALLMVTLLVPGYSQMIRKERTEKRHTSGLSFFKNTQNHLKTEKATKGFSFIETGTLGMRNNAHADSVLVYMNLDFKDGDLMLYAKEFPTYMEGSFRVKEVETWYVDDWKGFIPTEKSIAFYDENDELVRYEMYFWNDDQWQPDYAEELIKDENDQEIFYAWYFYDETALDWQMIDGHRAVDILDDNGLLSERTWEYFEMGEWSADFREVYHRNDQGILTAITEYSYYEWEQEWNAIFHMAFELGEDNTWETGYGYEWDYDLEDWYPTMKYVDIDWFDFDLLKISQVITMINANLWDDDDDWDNKTREEEIEWEYFMRSRGNYHEDGKLAMMELSIWEEDTWFPIMKMEQLYDHHQNLIFDAQSAYDPWEEEWVIIYGIKIDMEYNEDGSVRVADASLIMDEEWKNKFIHILRFEYYYPEVISTIPVYQRPESMMVYPNPANSSLTLVWNGDDEAVNITILSVDGRTVSRYEQYYPNPGEHIRIDVSHLRKGVYMVYCQGKKRQGVARFIKN